MSRTADPVSEQYESWPYPSPLYCLDAPFCSNYLFNHLVFWPHQTSVSDGEIHILVAGCGTNQAACIAHHYPTARVVGIDVSLASLKHERFLKRLYGLDNLTLHRMPIEDVSALGCDFDLILADGVLHHLQNPEQGLNALKQILRTEGSMRVMVYGKYPRAGVGMLQSFFRQLGLTQTEDHIGLVREAIEILPKSHPAQWTKSYGDLRYESGLVDMFLHHCCPVNLRGRAESLM